MTDESELVGWLAEPRQGRGTCAAGEGVALCSETSPRRMGNQDRAAYARLPNGQAVLIVADGMGGMADGERCASIAVANVLAYLLAVEAVDEWALSEAVKRANTAVHEAYHGVGGTTLTAIALAGGVACYAHAGDTRMYVLEGGTLRQVTQDHTALAAAEATGQAVMPAERALLGAQLNRAVGIDSGLEPDIGTVGGRAFLLSSDGLHDYVDPTDRPAEPKQAEAWVQRLVEAAAEAGTHDDATAAALSTQAATRTARDEGFTIWEPYSGSRTL